MDKVITLPDKLKDIVYCGEFLFLLQYLVVLIAAIVIISVVRIFLL